MRFTTIILLFYITIQTISQNYNTPFDQNRDALISIELINDIVSRIDTSAFTRKRMSPGVVDSICNSRKSISDYEIEKMSVTKTEFSGYLGNELEYFAHHIGRLRVSYVVHRETLLKINFKFSFTYSTVDDSVFRYIPSNSFVDSLRELASFPMSFDYSRQVREIAGFGSKILFSKTYDQILKFNKELIFNVFVRAEDREFEEDIELINDAAVSLTYGFGCGAGGDAPAGLGTFARMVHYGKIYLAEQLLFSPNPITRLMAVDAIEFYYSNRYDYSPNNKIRKKMNEVKGESTVISTCWGCFYQNLSMKEAYIKAAESKKHLYDNFFFIKN